MSLHGKVAIVTGSAQGIGRAIAESLAQAGADIVVADLDPGRSKDTVAAVEQLGRKALNVKVNVADANDTKAMVDQVLKEWGKVDILVNNAGITRDGLLLRMKEEDWNLVLQVNLNGTFNCTKAVLLPMTKQRYGRIVNIASIVGVMGNVGQANYAASKAAVIGLTKTVAREYASRSVTVNAVAPGFIDTAMTTGVVDGGERHAPEANSIGTVGHTGRYCGGGAFSRVGRGRLYHRARVARERGDVDALTDCGDRILYDAAATGSQRQGGSRMGKEAGKSMGTVDERVKKIIGEQLGVEEDEVTPEASFVEDLGADSLDTVELVMALEEEFGIEIPDEDAEKILTVGKALDYIKEKA